MDFIDIYNMKLCMLHIDEENSYRIDKVRNVGYILIKRIVIHYKENVNNVHFILIKINYNGIMRSIYA